ncbi:MAG: hydantoinase B/oxoprolinase family protein [Actinobacteria bacterium]|nr:hydantoinase B/oxoprolinase family protein [Actinomycetota bacterium]
MTGSITEVRAAPAVRSIERDVDPVTTEIVRQALASATRQMDLTLSRSACSQAMTESSDFCSGLFDADARLLVANRGALFALSMSFGVTAAVDAVGGRASLRDGDVLVINDGFLTGTHKNDIQIVCPLFVGETLLGYSSVRAHFLDVGGKEPLATDTTDFHQEGLTLPGVYLERAGERCDDLWRVLLSNTRYPREMAGDFEAVMAGCRAGGRAMGRLVARYGLDRLLDATEHILNHGEASMRSFLRSVPDGEYRADGAFDDDGIGDELIPFTIDVSVQGDEVVVDLTHDAPPEQHGPVNCPLPVTVAIVRTAIVSASGSANLINEGHMRPIVVRAREGTMFHPRTPAPINLYGWAFDIDFVLRALSDVVPAIPAGGCGDIGATMWWGEGDGDAAPWAMLEDHPGGQGASRVADGGPPTFPLVTAGMRKLPIEVWEASAPIRVESYELAPDSAGAGRHRGGLGIDVTYRALGDCRLTAIAERSKLAPWGLDGGLPGRANAITIGYPDGRQEHLTKVSGLRLTEGTTVTVRMGGGGGYGPPSERDPKRIAEDLAEGYLSEQACMRDYAEQAPNADPALTEAKA